MKKTAAATFPEVGAEPVATTEDPIIHFKSAESVMSQDSNSFASFRQRLNQFAGLSAVLAFMLVDLLTGMEAQAAFTDWKLVALFLPFLLIPIALTFSHEAPSSLTQYIFIALFVIGLAMAGYADITQQHSSWFNQESLTLATIYIYFLSGLRIHRALFCGLSAWLAFTVSQMSGGDLEAARAAFQSSYYLLVANLVGAGGLHYLEHHARQQHKTLARLRSESLLDEATGTLNRRAISVHLERVWRHAQRESKSLCVLRLNADGFHEMCRRLGPDAGNAFLQHVAKRLNEQARRTLDAVGRYGNDEFLVVWFDAHPSWLMALLQTLPAKFASFDAGTGIGLSPFTMSGAAVLAHPARVEGDGLQIFMDKISANLRRAKRQGQGRIMVSNLIDSVNPAVREYVTA